MDDFAVGDGADNNKDGESKYNISNVNKDAIERGGMLDWNFKVGYEVQAKMAELRGGGRGGKS